MEPFRQLTGVVAPLDRPNVDTDAIIPKQFLKSIRRTGFGPYLFDEWRYLDHGEPGQDCSHRPLNPEFVLNRPHYQDASILLVRDNFGCGSSREHAVWALADYGIRALIAPSFADIFYSNCCKNGIVPIVVAAQELDRLFAAVDKTPGYRLAVDLVAQRITTPEGAVIPFAIDGASRQRLLNGLDDISVTLQSADLIREYEERRCQEAPWLFLSS